MGVIYDGCGQLSPFGGHFLLILRSGQLVVPVVRNLEVVRFSEVLNTLFNSKVNWYFVVCPLYGGCRFRRSVNRGSTV